MYDCNRLSLFRNDLYLYFIDTVRFLDQLIRHADAFVEEVILSFFM